MSKDDLGFTENERGTLHQMFAEPLAEIAIRYAHKIAANLEKSVHELMETHIDETPRIVPISAHITSFHYGNRIAQEVMHILSIYFGYAHSEHPLSRLCEFMILPPEEPINKWEVALIIDLRSAHNKHHLLLHLEQLKNKYEREKNA